MCLRFVASRRLNFFFIHSRVCYVDASGGRGAHAINIHLDIMAISVTVIRGREERYASPMISSRAYAIFKLLLSIIIIYQKMVSQMT